MVIHVLNKDLQLVGIVDEYISVIWRPAYYDVGDFELYIDATADKIKLLQRDYYLVRDTDIIADSAGNVIYSNVMIIKNFILTTDAEMGDYYTVTGKELKYLLHQRIVWSQTNLTGTAENAIRQLVTENAISPTDSKRVIPTLTLGASAGLTDTIEKQVTGDYLDKAIVDICTAYSYGWEISIYNGALIFIVYQGLNKSLSQTERPFVVFSDNFDNIVNSSYQLTSDTYGNTALVGGEGEGAERIYTTVNSELSGLERYEVFVDAKDISQNKDSDKEITLSQYLLLLAERGKETLATLAVTEGFSGEVLTSHTFKYIEDFYLGDTVTVINKYGISKDVKILSVIDSIDETGTKLIPQFNI